MKRTSAQYVVVLLLITGFCVYWYLPDHKGRNTNQQALQELGHYLFFDPQLSVTGSKSCASCHNPQFAFTDGYRKTLGVFADIHERNTSGLINVSLNNHFNWASTLTTRLEQQMEQPLFSSHIAEMGLQHDDAALLKRLEQQDIYKQLFASAWKQKEKNISWVHIKQAIAAYVMSLQSYNAPYDRYKKGDSNAISSSAKKGMQLFFSNQLNCSSCHKPPGFGADSSLPITEQFHNIGLYNLKDGSYANNDNGLYNETGLTTDKGKFRTPTLRNLSFTAPYFHDGSAETLQEALQVFETGGRLLSTGSNAGDGRANPFKDKRLAGYSLTGTQRLQLVNFLLSLDDSTILNNPLFNNPFSFK